MMGIFPVIRPPLKRKLGFSEEIASFSRIDTTTEATFTILQTLTDSISPCLMLDAGCSIAARDNLPPKKG